MRLSRSLILTKCGANSTYTLKSAIVFDGYHKRFKNRKRRKWRFPFLDRGNCSPRVLPAAHTHTHSQKSHLAPTFLFIQFAQRLMVGGEVGPQRYICCVCAAWKQLNVLIWRIFGRNVNAKRFFFSSSLDIKIEFGSRLSAFTTSQACARMFLKKEK